MTLAEEFQSRNFSKASCTEQTLHALTLRRYLRTMDRHTMRNTMLRAGHRKHLPLRPRGHLQHHMPVRPQHIYLIPTTIPHHQNSSDPLQTHPLTPYPPRVCAFIIVFLEVPLLLRICPTSEKFDQFIRKFETNYMRAGIYLVMAVVQWLSLIISATSLIVAAVFLTIAGACYLLAAVRNQGFVGSKTLGGHGVAQMIV
jgi:hypothetical protein